MAEYGQLPNPWQSEIVVCKGGLVLNVDALTQGTSQQGTAKTLQNFEVALEGGYRRISGYTKWDSTTVPGQDEILGVKAALNEVFAARLNLAGTSTDIFASSGSGWGSKINSDTRGGAVEKVRLVTYSINKPVVVGCDGFNYAFKYDGTTYTILNGSGTFGADSTTSAPTNPKFAEMFNSSLALAGYTNNGGAQCVTISAPNTDQDFSAADGAVEINVGDVITGLKNFRNTLYVFCVNRIFKILVDATTTFSVSLVTDQIGCIASDTIQEIGGDLIYLSQDGFRSVAGTFNIGDVDLSLQSRQIQPLVRNNVLPLIEAGGIFSSCAVNSKSQYRCVFHVPGDIPSNTLGVIGKVEQGQYLSGFNQTFVEYSWSTTLGIQCHSMDSYFINGMEVVVMGDHSTGYVYRLESGNDFDGTPINAVYESPYLTFKEASLRKVMQKTTIYSEAEGAANLNLNLLFDFQGVGVLQPSTIPLIFSGTFATYGTGIYGTDFYASVVFPIFKQNLVGSGFTTAFQYSSTGGAPYRIDSYEITYGLKGRR